MSSATAQQLKLFVASPNFSQKRYNDVLNGLKKIVAVICPNLEPFTHTDLCSMLALSPLQARVFITVLVTFNLIKPVPVGEAKIEYYPLLSQNDLTQDQERKQINEKF